MANRLNLKAEEKYILPMRSGWYLNRNSVRVVLETRSIECKQKRIRSIFNERGLFNSRMQSKEARDILSKQDDFREQKSLLEEAVFFEWTRI